ncbi:MAG: glycosyltransferase [Rickettsiales bacterium]|nr:MAG: glycosyltransferase [Rickettsiales bacterium]
MVKLSGFIIAKNEATRITKAINSIKNIVEEVIVIDSGSTDDTVKIAEKLGARVVYNEWKGYVLQKSFGESLCKNDWILNIDADEEFTQKLQDEIAGIFAEERQDDCHAYEVNFVVMHRNDKKLRFLAPANRFIRVYNRNYCSFSNVKETTTHDAVMFNKDTPKDSYKLKGAAYHRSGTSITQLVAKANFYSSEQAKDWKKLGRKPSNFRIALELPLCFLKAFFIRRHCVFGFDGFVDSMVFAFARFIRIAKTREIYRNEESEANTGFRKT